jgi:hypothetical protein
VKDNVLYRDPCEKPKMQAVGGERVSTDSATAKFLEEAVWLQHTFVGRNQTQYEETHEEELSFFKGAMLVVPDHLWPNDGPYAECDTVFSAEDEKTRTGWDRKEHKKRHKDPIRIDYAMPVKKEKTDDVQEFNFGMSSRF